MSSSSQLIFFRFVLDGLGDGLGLGEYPRPDFGLGLLGDELGDFGLGDGLGDFGLGLLGDELGDFGLGDGLGDVGQGDGLGDVGGGVMKIDDIPRIGVELGFGDWLSFVLDFILGDVGDGDAEGDDILGLGYLDLEELGLGDGLDLGDELNGEGDVVVLDF